MLYFVLKVLHHLASRQKSTRHTCFMVEKEIYQSCIDIYKSRDKYVFFCLRWYGPRRVLYRVQLTRPPLTELNQCAFTSDSYLFYSPTDIWNALFRTFVLTLLSHPTLKNDFKRLTGLMASKQLSLSAALNELVIKH